jgi:hypothetical protein
MLRNAFLFICLSVGSGVFSQELETFQKLELGVNGIGMSLETPVAKKILLEAAIGLGPNYDLHTEESGLTDKMDWSWALLEPGFHGSVYGKFFYNRNKRAEKGKSLRLNSGHFVGAKVKYISKSLSDTAFYSNTLLANLNWGGQFNLGKHWFYGYSVGLGYGYNIDKPYGLFYPAFDLKIGYVLPFFSKAKK